MRTRYFALLLAGALALAAPAHAANCTYTLGYWWNHGSVWPVTTLQLGTVSYNQSQLMSILANDPSTNGLVQLSRQLIAVKLNIAFGANASAISTTVAQADALIGGLVVPPVGSDYLAPSVTGALIIQLDYFNTGIIGPGHCDGTTAARASTWGRIKTLYR